MSLSKRADVADALLPINLWDTFGRELLDAMPEKYRVEIGRKAIEGASYVSQLETINASRHARGVKPLTMTLFAAGGGDGEEA
jgi:hypothetical protein